MVSTNFKDAGTKYCKTEAEINAYNEDYYDYDNNEDGIIEEKPDCKPPPDDRYSMDRQCCSVLTEKVLFIHMNEIYQSL